MEDDLGGQRKDKWIADEMTLYRIYLGISIVPIRRLLKFGIAEKGFVSWSRVHFVSAYNYMARNIVEQRRKRDRIHVEKC